MRSGGWWGRGLRGLATGHEGFGGDVVAEEVGVDGFEDGGIRGARRGPEAWMVAPVPGLDERKELR